VSGPFNPNDLNQRPRVDDGIWLGMFYGFVFTLGFVAVGFAVLAMTGVV
jgi:hypothetical protein